MKKMIIPKALFTSLVAFVALVGVFLGVYHASQVITPPVDNSLGAVSGNEIQGNELVLGGLSEYAYKVGMAATSTNTCSIKSPAATTTLVRVSAQSTMSPVNKKSSTITDISVYKGANYWATTTLVTGQTLAAGNNFEFASSTQYGNQSILIPPNTYFNFALTGTSTGDLGLSGACTLTLRGL